jgi:hypothetical protein
MYRASGIALLLVLPLLAVGQQWTLLRPGWKYNYAITNSGVVDAQIFITATDTPDVGVVTHDLNRVAEWCDTCASNYRMDLTQFLERSVTVSNDVWYFHDPASVVVLPLAELGSAWVMDTLANVIAQVTAVDTLEQFGVPDVQKTISCNNGDIWVLSQEWGIMRVNDLELRGIQGPDVGILIPGIEQMYPYQPGDIMEITKSAYGFTTNGVFPAGSYVLEANFTILDRTVQDGNVSLNTWELAKSSTTLPAGSASSITLYSAWQDTVVWTTSVLELPQRDLMFSYPGELVSSGHQIYGESEHFPCVARHRIDSLGRYCMECDLHVCQSLINARYVQGIGLERYAWSCVVGESYVMVGTVINGDTSGVIFPDDHYSGISENALATLKVYPNPATDHLVVEGLGPSGAMLTLSDLQGRPVVQRKVNASSTTLDISSLSDGIYTLSVPQTRNLIPVRVVVAH